MASALDRYMTPEELAQLEVQAIQSPLASDPAQISMEDLMSVSSNDPMAAYGPMSQTSVPEAMQSKDVAALYDQKARAAAIQEQQGISQLEQYIKDYQQKPRGIDWRPLAALFPENKALMESSQALAPESENQKAANILALQQKLQASKHALTTGQMSGLANQLKMQMAAQRQAQLDDFTKQRLEMDKQRQAELQKYRAALESMRREEMGARKAQKEEAQQEKTDARIEKELQRFEEKAADLAPASANLAVIEDIMGGSLDDYDEKTNTLNGQPVDLPGKSVPLVGRMFEPGSDGERLQSAIATLFNTELKSRSGAAVTDQELMRLRSEFNSGKFNTEAKMVEALKKYKNILRTRALQHESAYRPEVLDVYKKRGGQLVDTLIPKGRGQKPVMSFDEWKKSKGM